MIAELVVTPLAAGAPASAVPEADAVLLVQLDEVAETQLERPAADVPLRGRVVWADQARRELQGEHVLMCLVEKGAWWWQRPGPVVVVEAERAREEAAPARWQARLATLR